jgi:hypothetical protein
MVSPACWIGDPPWYLADSRGFSFSVLIFLSFLITL